jgi:hypothetical protein
MALQEQIGGLAELELELEVVVVVAAANDGDKGAVPPPPPPAAVKEIDAVDSAIRRASIPPIKSATLEKPSLTKDDANYAR